MLLFIPNHRQRAIASCLRNTSCSMSCGQVVMARRGKREQEKDEERVVRRRVSEAVEQHGKDKTHSDETHGACAFAQVLCAARRAKYETHRQRRQTLLPWTPWWRANHRPNSSLLLHLQRLGPSLFVTTSIALTFFQLVPGPQQLANGTSGRQRVLCTVTAYVPPARILSPRPTRTSSARQRNLLAGVASSCVNRRCGAEWVVLLKSPCTPRQKRHMHE
jgi:hypothetical protein